MTQSYRIVGIVVFLVVLLTVGCGGETGDREPMPESGDAAVEASLDPVDVAPEVYSVMHEDERVRVLEMKLPAGAADGLHNHPDEAAYFIKGAKLQITTPDGEVTEVEIPDGAPFSHEAWTHTVENIGETDLHAIVFEIKEGALAGAGSVEEGMGAAEVSPDVYSVMHEDERVRILEMKLPAGASDQQHTHPSEVVYFLKGGKAKVYLPDGEVAEAEAPDGGVMSHETWTHRLENIGETDVHAIIVELKEPPM